MKNYLIAIICFGAALMSTQEALADCQLGCKQYTQVSLGIDCTAEITPDILLSNGSDCAGPFVIQLMTEDMQPLPSSPFLGPEHVGMTLMASLQDMDSGNQCMVTLFVEDKFTPDLICGTTAVSCDAFMGFSIPNQFIANTGWSVTNDCEDIIIPVAGFTSLSDVNLSLSFEITNAIGVQVTLTSPMGTAVTIFDGNTISPACTNAAYDVIFDDQSLNDNATFLAACAANDAEIIGLFQSLDQLSDILADSDANGNWILTICAGAGATLDLAAYDLQLSAEQIIIPFPVPAGTQVTEQNGDYILTGYDACGNATLSYTDDENDESCASEYQQTILRNWLVTDESGNTDACVQTILVERRDPSEIVMPPNYFPGQAGALACEDKMVDPGNAIIPNIGWNALPNGHPSPYNEYYPAPNNDVIKWFGTGTPAVGACDDLSIFFEDTRINVCQTGTSDGCFTIKRQWMVFEHCTGEMFMHDQLIKVMDIVDPVISGIMDITLEILENVCSTTAYAPIPTLSDNCSASSDLSYEFDSNNGDVSYIEALDQYVVENLPEGISIFTYSVSDCCGNSMELSIQVTVIDAVPPTVVCKDAQVNLTIDGTAKLFPESIDDGSNDNCQDQLYFKIIRVDDLQNTVHGSDANQLNTGCDTLNGDDNILLLGNQIYFDDFAKFCCEDIPGVMVILRVFDIDPGTGPIDPDDMKPGGFLHGHFNDCMRLVEVNDKLTPTITCPPDVTLDCDQDYEDLTLTGSAVGEDNCEIPTVTFTDDTTGVNMCGIGAIIRTWKATDALGRMTTCQQTISLQDTTAPIITYPADITVDCELIADLDITGRPEVMDNCDLIGFSHADDQPIPLFDQCGYRVIRRWSGWSLCDNTQTYMGTQTIITIDTTGPTLQGMLSDITVSCANEIPAAGGITAIDNCSAFNPTNLDFAEVKVDSICPNRFILGRNWTATDSCNNMTSITQSITVDDQIAPTLSIASADITLSCGEVVPDIPLVTADDNCGPLTANDIMFSEESGTMFCTDGLVRTRVWTVIDACGNTASVTRRYFQPDNEPPMILNPPMDLNLSCNDPIPPAATIVATDDCTAQVDLVIALVETVLDSTCVHDFTIRRMWTVTDGCGKTAMHTQDITITDNEPPMFINAPADVDLDCNQSIPLAIIGASDDCTSASDLVMDFVETYSDSTCIFDFTLTRVWTVTDQCGKTAEHTQVITKSDNEPPMFINPPADVDLNCSDPIPAAQITASDDCTATDDLIIDLVETVSDSTCIFDFTLTRVWTVTDQCGKTAEHTQVITKSDNEPPMFTNPPADVDLNCADPIPTAQITASDDCTTTNDLVINFAETVTDSTCIFDFTLTRVWTVTDQCGKTAEHTQVITKSDNEPPMFTNPPADVDLNCTDPIPAAQITASDDCTATNDLVIDFVEIVTDSTCIFDFTLTRVWTVTDQCGKTAEHTQVITKSDNEPPMFTNPPMDIVLDCNMPIPSVPILTYSDDCTAVDDIVFEFMETVSDSVCVNTLNVTRIWTITDQCGKTAQHTQVISKVDNEFPVFTFVPMDVTLSCEQQPQFDDADVMDNCGLLASFEEESDTNNICSGNYVITRTWTAVDLCGMTTVEQQVITVVDTIPPVVTGIPADVTVNCNSVPGLPSPSIMDNCALQSELGLGVRTDTIFGNCIYNYILVRNWFARDDCNNRDTIIQRITVQDVKDPFFNFFPDDIDLTCFENTTPLPGTIFEGPTALDDCDPDVAITYSDSMDMGTCQMITRTWTATDECGNSVSADQVITFTDDQAPVFNMDPADITINCDDPLPMPIITATDDCEIQGGIIFTQDSIPGFCPYAYELNRKWIASDLCGNIDSVEQSITVQDLEKPVVQFEFPADEIITIDCEDAIPPIPNIVVTDNCSPTDSITFSFGSTTITEANDQDFGIDITCPTISIIQRTWIFFDQCGNSEDLFQEITVRDTMAPTFTLGGPDFLLECGTDISPTIGSPFEVTVIDNCTAMPIVNFIDIKFPGEPCVDSTVMRVWTARDSCLNVRTATQTFVFEDTTAPTITCPTVDTVKIGGIFPNPHICDTILNLLPASIMDSCDMNLTVTNSINSDIGGISTYAFPLGVTNFQFTATDSCGNAASCDVQVVVEDVRSPTVTTEFGNCYELGIENSPLTLNVSDLVFFEDCSLPVEAVFIPQGTPDITLTFVDLGFNILTIGFEDSAGNIGSFPLLINLLANGGCPTPGPATAAGKIKTPLSMEVAEVEVHIDEMNEVVMTDENGEFAINDPEVGPGYSFEPRYNERIRDGVTTLDLVIISRHVIGLVPITDPHFLIAADVDYSGSINGVDLLKLQQVILFIHDEFPDGDAWRFVEESYLWPLSGSPFDSPFPEMIMIDEVMNDYMHLNFTAIKLGDVNASIQMGQADALDRSQLDEFGLSLKNHQFRAGERLQVPVFATQEELLQGFEIEINKDQSIAMMELSAGQINPVSSTKEGRLLAQWVAGEGQTLNLDEPLFYITIEAQRPGQLKDALSFSNDYFTNTAYSNEKASHVVTLNINELDNTLVTSEVYVPVFYPNVPNPFHKETLLRFFMPRSGSATLQITNLDGRVIYRSTADYEKGYQELALDGSQLISGGVLQCQLITAQGTVSQKILFIKD